MLTLLLALAVAGAPPDAGTRSRFELCARDGVGSHGYSYTELLAWHRTQPPAPCTFRVSEDDVEIYRVGRAPDGEVDLVLKVRPAKSCGEGPFTVSLDGQELFVGQCYLPMGAAGLVYPVLHEAEEGGRSVLQLRATQMGAGDGEANARVDPRALRLFFYALGMLNFR
jgi:hypothetical protein